MTEEKKSKKGLIIALAILSILALAGNAYQFFKKKHVAEPKQEQNNNDLVNEAVTETEDLIASLEIEKNMAIDHIDSLEMELSFWKQEVDRVKLNSSGNALSNSERNRLLGQISTLRNRIAAYANKEQLLDSFTRQNLSYELALNASIDSMSRIKRKADSLAQSVNTLTTANKGLNDKINNAGKPVFSTLNVYGIDNRKKGDRTTFDASRIEELFIAFKLIGNDLFKGNLEEELKVRLTGPEGQLYMKAGNTIANARQEDFTFLESFTYTGKSKVFSLSLKPLKSLSKGKHKIELFENGQIVQETIITLY